MIVSAVENKEKKLINREKKKLELLEDSDSEFDAEDESVGEDEDDEVDDGLPSFSKKVADMSFDEKEKLYLHLIAEDKKKDKSKRLSDSRSDYSNLGKPGKKEYRRLSYTGDTDSSMQDVVKRNGKLKAEKKRLELEIASLKQKRKPDEWVQIQAMPTDERTRLVSYISRLR